MERVLKDELYRFLFENSYDAILLTHPDGNVYRANPAACEMFQRDEAELCKLGRSGIVDLDDPRLEPALREREIKGKTRTELNFKRKDGSIFPTDCASTIFKDVEGATWAVIILHDMSAFKQAEEAMRTAQEQSTYYATYDYLTGTLNRRAFMDKLQQELHRLKRENTLLSLILLDIDYFKHFNDTMGHSCGDAVLKNVAACLFEKLRPYDILGRYGGDEFVVCMPNTNSEEAYKIAERLRAHVENKNMLCENKSFTVTISIGLACYDMNLNEEADSLIIRADKNMYLAKQRRNTVCGE